MILAPRTANWHRFRKLCTTQYSLLRSLEYEALTGLTLQGRTVDIGGGTRTSYQHLIEFDGPVDSVNIDPDIGASIIADLNQPLPIASDTYDNAISLNTFEHIEQDVTAITETLRVLKPGGQFHIMVPFLYRVHASPSDYHRHTAYWWENMLVAAGADRNTLRIDPLMFDVLSSAYSLAEFYLPFRALVKRLLMFVAVLPKLVRSRHRAERLPESVGAAYAEWALGYYMHGTKARSVAKAA